MRNLFLVIEEEFLSAKTDVEKGLICSADRLPVLITDIADMYFCLTDTLFVWNGKQWVSVIDGTIVLTQEQLAQHVNTDSSAEKEENSVYMPVDDIERHASSSGQKKDIRESEETIPKEPISNDYFESIEHILALDAPSIAQYLLDMKITPEASDVYHLLVECVHRQRCAAKPARLSIDSAVIEHGFRTD